jgi:uncharacterized protein YkwD
MVTRFAICAAVVLLAATAHGKEGATRHELTPKAADAAKAKSDLLPIENNIVECTNRERKRYGLPPLVLDRELLKSAREHAKWMSRNRSLRHTSRPVAENIAMGYTSSMSVVRGWMNSSGHRANILSRSHRRIGVAAYQTAGGMIYWCQQFRR